MTNLKKRRSDQVHELPAVTVYVTPTCVNCPKTLKVLRDHNVPHTSVDLTADKDAYTYVTQELKYKQAPAVEVHHQHEIITWTGHHPQWISEHILQWYRNETDADRMARAAANTTAAIRNSGLGGRTTGPHLPFQAEPGPEVVRSPGGEKL